MGADELYFRAVPADTRYVYEPNRLYFDCGIPVLSGDLLAKLICGFEKWPFTSRAYMCCYGTVIIGAPDRYRVAEDQARF
ncbi:MAG: hypothetical protein B7Z75_06445 [Acidocella sp. 20-57-95]|nr:MAG: hypothetical protein B7Z75_06445 [Acidocella sp. 20-57-95]HQT64781.1 hypothetical protein [Acidocella sp.]